MTGDGTHRIGEAPQMAPDRPAVTTLRAPLSRGMPARRDVPEGPKATGARRAPVAVMVEAAGIEPASASTTLQDLRAYPAY